MPLDKNIFITEVRKINDESFSNFQGFPEKSEVPQKWASVLKTYAANIIPPSTTINEAEAAAISAFNILAVDAISGFAAGFSAFASTLALGMQPTYSATPPPSPIAFPTVYAIGLAGGNGEACAIEMGNIADTWFRTGIAVNNSSGVTINWN